MNGRRFFFLLSCFWCVLVLSAVERSRVCRLTIPRAVDAAWDMELILFHRSSGFHHGYALVPGRDQVPHRVDVTPSQPIQWQKADGAPLHVPERMRGYYSYKLEEFRSYKEQYEKGTIKIAYPIPTPPLTWSDGKLTGTVDVLIAPVNLSNKTGRGPLDTAYRIRIDAEKDVNDSFKGTAAWWTYEKNDVSYGADRTKTTCTIENGRWDAGYWKPAGGSGLAEGAAWPQARGLMLNGAATDCTQPLVDNLEDAKLIWVGEEIIGGGRGAVLSRGGFAMYPYAWQNISYGAFAGVTVADDKVFQYLTHPDEALVAADTEIARNVYVQLGADPRTLANERGHMRDTVLCLDAHTGKTLWWFKSKETFVKIKSGKGGIGMTACFYTGRVYARGSGGLYCLNAETGALLWKKKQVKQGKVKVSLGPSGGWSHDESPVIVGGVLVLGHGKDEALAGFDPSDGRLLWTHSFVKGQNAVPTKVILDAKEHIIVCSKEKARLSLIEPRTGTILWHSNALGPNHGSLSVWETIVCGNLGDRTKQKQGRARAVRISRKGASPLWTSKEAGYPPHRSLPVAHKGFFYIDDREGFFCLDTTTGNVVNRLPHISTMTLGSHNWVWTIASNNRVFTSGVLMTSTAEGGFVRLPGRLSLDLAGGYTCPIKPALADGRLFCRLSDKIVCYDLRKDPRRVSRTITLTCPQAFASSVEADNAVQLKLRIVDGSITIASARWPEVVGPEAMEVAEKWAVWYKKPLSWRPYPATGLTLSDNRLSGNLRLPMGWHFEMWNLDLARKAGRFSGVFTRSIPAVKNPLPVQGDVTGKTFSTETGQCFELRLAQAAAQFHRSDDLRPVTIICMRKKNGDIRAWAVAGKVNSMAHEVDPGKLSIYISGAVRGSVTCLFRDDPYLHLNHASKTSVAGTYTFDASIQNDGTITGSYKGTFGHAWERKGTITGRIEEAP